MRRDQGNRTLVQAAMAATLLAAAVAGCERQAPAPPAQAPKPPAAQPQAVVLKDVVENDLRYVVGISYPPSVNAYPGLAAALQRYSDAARAELRQAVEGMGADKPPAPYDLSLSFSELAGTPQIVAIAADGSSYTGGAHGNPLIARFVWLPQQNRMLTATELIPDPAAWTGISAYVREQLHAALSQRVDADETPPEDRVEIVRNAGKMIDEGTAPNAANYAQFEPMVGPDGRLAGLRFVFPPYQVGPYSDGVQSVEVPAAVLLPRVAPAYRGLFAGRPVAAAAPATAPRR